MKLKSIISKTLVIGLLLNNGLTSLAGVLSEDGRYETFEGSSITIDNILEEDKVDIEIEGNTLISPMKNVSYSGYSKVDMKKMENGRIVNDSTSGVSSNNNYYMMDTDSKEYLRLKKDTTYTIFISGRIDFDESNLNRFVVPFYRNLNDGVPVTRVIKTINVSQDTYFNETIVFTTNNQDMESFGFYISNALSIVKNVDMYFHVIEGDLSNERISYFEGMKSVGEDNENNYSIEINPSNKNLFDGKLELGTIDINSGELRDAPNEVRSSNYIDLYNAKTITITRTSAKELDALAFRFYDKNKNYIGTVNGTLESIATREIPYLNARYMKFKDMTGDLNATYQIEITTKSTGYIEHQSNKIQILLSEPLRSVGDVKDRIIKRNGQWVVERNLKEIVLNGEEGWYVPGEIFGTNTLLFAIILDDAKPKSSIVCDTFIHDSSQWSSDKESINLYTNKNLDIRINKDKLSKESPDGLKEWLASNNVRVVYQLEEPIYEPIKADLSVQLFEGTTHISNNSIVPTNMKITVDRTINRAVEAVELAKTNPTVENLSKARMWVNLLDESIKKDELQGEINSISNLNDMVLERKTATSNLDVYVMCENMLSMSLNTNSITFNNYSGVEDMEKLNALEISINSSLPYDLNAYLQSEIKGSENFNIMDMDILKIKDNSKQEYQSFSNTTDKVILNEDCASGNYISHNIDIKLESNNAYSVDVYKTTIKFEAVQK